MDVFLWDPLTQLKNALKFELNCVNASLKIEKPQVSLDSQLMDVIPKAEDSLSFVSL